MLRVSQVHRAVWALFVGVLTVAVCNTVIVCGLCPQKSTLPPHCSGKDSHAAAPVTNEALNEALTTPDSGASCSHCVTHSPWQTNPSSNATLPNHSPHAYVAADLDAVVVEFSASNNLVEIHDHGPPGNPGPRYILNSAFRI